MSKGTNTVEKKLPGISVTVMQTNIGVQDGKKRKAVGDATNDDPQRKNTCNPGPTSNPTQLPQARTVETCLAPPANTSLRDFEETCATNQYRKIHLQNSTGTGAGATMDGFLRCLEGQTNLTHLFLAGCSSITNVGWAALVETLQKCRVVHLDLANCRITDGVVRQLSSSDSLKQNLQHLDVRGSNGELTDAGVQDLGKFTQLRFLALQGPVKKLAPLKNLTSLEHLALLECKELGGEELLGFCPHLKHLRELEITQCPNLSYSRGDFGPIRCFESVRRLNLSGCDLRHCPIGLLTHFSNLTHLNLSGPSSFFQNEAASKAELLSRTSPGLRHLDISNGEGKFDDTQIWPTAFFQGEAASKAKRLSSTSPGLQHLDISNGEGKFDDAQIVLDNLGPLKGSLQYLDVSGNPAVKSLTRFLEGEGASALQHLNLSKCNIYDYDQGSDYMFNKLPKLLYLNLSHCQRIGGKIFQNIVQSSPQLRHLDLSHCKYFGFELPATNPVTGKPYQPSSLTYLNLSSGGWTMSGSQFFRSQNFGDLVGVFPDLQHLHLGEYEGLNDADIEAVCTLSQLRTLDLRRSGGSHMVKGTCFSHLRELRLLESLNWSGSVAVNSEAVTHLYELKQLQKLDLSSCPKITSQALTDLVRENPALQTLHIGPLNITPLVPFLFPTTRQTNSNGQRRNSSGEQRFVDLPVDIFRSHLASFLSVKEIANLKQVKKNDNVANSTPWGDIYKNRTYFVPRSTTPEVFEQLCRDRQFTHVDFRNIHERTSIAPFIAGMHELKNLKSLGLSGHHDLGDSLSHLQDLTTLEKLDLSYCPVTGPTMQHLGALKQLQHLNLDTRGITREMLRILQGLPVLKYLRVRLDPAQMICLNPLEHLVMINPSTSFLPRYDNTVNNPNLGSLNDMKDLERLDLHGTDTIQHLHGLTSLRYLKLFNNYSRGEKYWSPIAEIPHLTHLELENCNIPYAVQKRLGEILHRVTHLKTGNLNISVQGLGSLSQLTQLTHLDLEGGVRPEKWVSWMKPMPQLTHLNLSQRSREVTNLFRRSGLEILTDTFEAKIDTNAELETLVGNFPNLQSLELENALGSGITGEGLAHLLRLVSLRTLDLSDCKTIKDGDALVNLSTLPLLQHLGLARCPLVTEQSLSHFYQLVPKLELLRAGPVTLTTATHR